ncbi:spermidine synthase [Clostridiales bacterium PH28_bin88]|nr:spermidine synthase [Clostridiales bacterium PH28_bin88]
MQGVWFTELQNSGLGISCRTKAVLHQEKTKFQNLLMLDTEVFGRMLVLDGAIQTSIKDEFVYHEMISLVALNTHPDPRRVLVVGGGDGGAIREIVKHPQVERATLVEIDQGVIDTARRYLPEISHALDHPKVEVLVEDGIKHIQERESYYDIILVDSTDPVGPAVGLFAADFYRQIHKALTGEGIFVAQTESPWFNQELIRQVYRSVSDIFPIAKLYLANIPTYPSGLWSFTMGSKQHDPEKVDITRIPETDTRYYTPQLHLAAFNLPKFVKELLQG